uniref:Cell wall protein-like n=1 Tax=Oryza sativa subsp. japonica TaxID=39947 RepID=Q69KP3_ORYSJ|nr:cell wall protein-like [Oryza sativa Japonica Group]
MTTRPCRRVTTPAGRAVASSSTAAASSSPAYPPFPAETSGSASPPATVVLPPRFRLRPPLPRPRCAGRRRHHLSRHRSAVLSPGQATVSPEFRRNAVISAPASPSSSSARRPAAPPPSPTSQRRVPRRPLLRSAAAACHHRFIVVSDRSRRRRPVGRPARRLAAPPPSSSSLRRVPRRPRPRAAAAGCPRRLLAGPGRRRCRRPLVVPGRRDVRPSVEPFSFVVRVRQASCCSPVLFFVLASASSSPVPAASRLRSRIAAEVVPSPSVSAAPVRRCRSHASSRGGKVSSSRCPVLVLSVSPVPVVRLSTPWSPFVGHSPRLTHGVRFRRPVDRLCVLGLPRSFRLTCGACSFACVLRVAFVVPEVPEAWFAVVAEGSEGRSL